MDEICFAAAFVEKAFANQIPAQEELGAVSRWQDAVAIAIGQFFPINDSIKLEGGISFLSKMKHRFPDKPEIYKQLFSILMDHQQHLFIAPEITMLFKNSPDLLEEVKRFLPQSAFSVNAVERPDTAAVAKGTKKTPIRLSKRLKVITEGDSGIIRTDGFIQLPVSLAGPLSISGKHQQQTVYTPLATIEPTLSTACSRGCKVFQASGGVQAIALSEGMSRGAVFIFSTVDDAVNFYQHVPCLEKSFRMSAEGIDKYARLVELVPNIIGRTVHVKFVYKCSDTVRQQMVTIATHQACQDWMKSADANDFRVIDFKSEGPLLSDRSPTIVAPQGVQVLAWGRVSSAACQEVFGCTTADFHQAILRLNGWSTHNGQAGQMVNTADIMAAMFIACGQDAASVLRCGWSHLTSELDSDNQQLTLSLYFPSVAVSTVGGGTQYPTQREALELMGCSGPEKKLALAETVAAFALALSISTIESFCKNTARELPRL